MSRDACLVHSAQLAQSFVPLQKKESEEHDCVCSIFNAFHFACEGAFWLCYILQLSRLEQIHENFSVS